jgi:ATP-dependent RNA helicase DDX56/DBP9
MKRKRNHDAEEAELVSTAIPEPEKAVDGKISFVDLGLDSRLLQAVVKQKFSHPTLVQAKTIPLALEGKDILGEELRVIRW